MEQAAIWHSTVTGILKALAFLAQMYHHKAMQPLHYLAVYTVGYPGR